MPRMVLRILLLCQIVFTFAVLQISAQPGRMKSAPDQMGPYAIGHTSYTFTNLDADNRPVFLSLWYPANPDKTSQSATPAEYLIDPYTGTTNVPASHSGDWEALGYDPAFEVAEPSKGGPFPLLITSPGLGGSYWQLIYVGTRLASHGYVVAAIEHRTECQWPWGPCERPILNAVYRPRDISFAITQLETMSETKGGPLYHLIDRNSIVAGGFSFGGYATYALAGGDKLVCDDLWLANNGYDFLPYPDETCVSTAVDPRIKAIVTLDGATWLFHYRELANIGVPSLILNEGVDQWEQFPPWGPDQRDAAARAHAAIDRPDSYRVDIIGTNHFSFSDQCDAMQILYSKGLLPNDPTTSWPCASWAMTVTSAEAHAAITKYMIAFLDVYLGHSDQTERSILTPEYALTHSPTVQFFNDEGCKATLPDHTYFKYRPYQTSDACEVAQRDPSNYFPTE